VFNDAVQAVITGSKSTEAALKDAQRDADRILKEFK